jgi:cytochrome c-type biogenesis protein CcsB
MDYTSFEPLLIKYSFGMLLLGMIFYWVKASLFSIQKFNYLGSIFILISNFCLTFLLIFRWISSNHFPLSNLYESLIFLSWSLTFCQLFFENKTKNFYIGIIMTPISLFVLAFATFSLPEEMQKSSSLVPALQSNWLMMHVTVMILSYAALIFGSLLSLAYLVLVYSKINIFKGYSSFLNQKIKEKLFTKNNLDKSLTQPNEILQANTGILFNQPEIDENFDEINLIIKNLDNLSYRILGIGFPLLTIGILSGAVWANETWGSYWNWDPKETWALITWFIFAIYLHTRITKGWKGEKSAIIASIGFFVVWICFLGVNLFAKGLHSYGWIVSN